MNWTSISTVAFVCILILSLATCYTTIYLPALYRHNATTFWLLTPSCLIPLLIGFYCYMKSVWISPGYTPANSEMRSRSEQEKQYKQLMKLKKITPEIRRREIRNLVVDSYCEKCSDIKPSRTHHCKICKRCITRMDHHCPWVGNCIGKHNHKFFFLFLLYMTVTLLIVSVSIFADFINPQQPLLTRINQSDEMYLILTLLTGGMCVMLMFSVGFLLISQFLLLLNNLTTLESFYEGIYQHNPFEKETFRENAKDIMGDSWWFLPTEPFPGERKETNVAFTE